MKKIILIVFCLLISVGNGKLIAKSSDRPKQFEETYFEIGYQSVEEASKAFEHHFKQDVKLPFRHPAVGFTHQFGRFSNINQSFEVKYLNDKIPENHYKIDIRPVDYSIRLRDHNILRTYKLNDGNKASYLNISGFNVLVFKKENWQYMLSIDKRVSDKVTPQTLVEIANSIDYQTKKKSSLLN